MTVTDIHSLERELERIRGILHRKVGADPTLLSHGAILPISRRLDHLLNRYHQLKQKTP
ncbi:Spo0E family sporulation regulatory protein-aspartic acid phosphatase [Desmospora profundinema]|uniref:Spo0E like sporulation regulatory protein n=1 Tax=Desmospora profundinema TaxID=1571184 RepID=A0ABU1IHQ8_9BACL|nr:Spo0E family sporulation regulatory protein-aspartic acid phosphatase [Desmospora profundinema]MDR6224226.1 hypothetical protein [Desmospora profundinema]